MANVMSGSVSTTKAIEVPSWIRGYHAYKELWSIEIDEVLELKHQHNNEQDKNAIAVIRKGDVVGHIPRALANTKDGAGIVRHFLTKHGSKADVKVVGKAGWEWRFQVFIDLSDRKGILTCLVSCWIFPITCLLGLKKLNVVKNVRQKTAAGVRSQNAIKLSLKPDADATVKSTLRLI